MNEITTINPDDARLAKLLVHELIAATSAHELIRIRNICYGSGVVILTSGIALAALVWAWNQHTDPELVKAALADLPPLKVETLVNGTVKLDEGGTVKVAGGTVELAPGATVELEQSAQLKLPELPAPAKTPDGHKISREVTVFNSVPYGDGTVMTGWTFPNGGGKTPVREFCYFTKPNPDGSTHRVELAQEGRFDETAPGLLAGAEAASSKCIWFKGAV